jgi:preprotein translocase subunit SecF
MQTLNTTMTVVLTLLVLMLFGGTTIRPFVLAILIGITVGGYSAVLFSNMLLVSWRVGELGRLLSFLPIRRFAELRRA